MGGRPPAAETENSSEVSLTIGDLVDQHYRVVYAYAYRLTGKPNDAEDLTQQTYLTAHQKLDQLREPDRARSWLFRILRNKFIRSLQKRQPPPASELNVDIGEFAKSSKIEDIDSERLQIAISGLPDEYKLVVMLFYFEELSYKQIAAELDIPIGTVMSRLARAKAALRGKLSQTDIES